VVGEVGAPGDRRLRNDRSRDQGRLGKGETRGLGFKVK